MGIFADAGLTAESKKPSLLNPNPFNPYQPSRISFHF